MSNLKILYCYSWFDSEAYGNIQSMALSYFERLVKAGFKVEGFCLTLKPPASALLFEELDALWNRGDKTLLNMYENLEKHLDGKDVLINGSGINLHPEFVEKLPVFSVFQCFDDPENSENLSKPVATSYDLCLVGNIAEVSTYRSWGVKNVEWIPMGLNPSIYDTSLTYNEILNGKRDIDLFMMIDRLYPQRKERLDKLANVFTDAHFYGRGWDKGYLANNMEREYLRRAKIGPNIHNSTGPINFRTFYLPANGIMQICDNKNYLAKIYKLNKEVVGFETIDECIELCRYYLAHDDERRHIAANGWKRAITDYNEVSVFKRSLDIIEGFINSKNNKEYKFISREHRQKTIFKRNKYYLLNLPINFLRKIYNKIYGLFKIRKNIQLPKNIGQNLLEWPERALEALQMLNNLDFDNKEEVRIADFGCGKQTLRKLIKKEWKYFPYDYCKRSDDTTICDFNNKLPSGNFEVIFCLGVLEYLSDPLILIKHMSKITRYYIFSYNGFTTQERRDVQGWKSNLTFQELEDFICSCGSKIIFTEKLGKNEQLFCCEV